MNQCFDNHLCSRHQVPDEKNRDASQNIGSLTIQPPNVAASQKNISLNNILQKMKCVIQMLQVHFQHNHKCEKLTSVASRVKAVTYTLNIPGLGTVTS